MTSATQNGDEDFDGSESPPPVHMVRREWFDDFYAREYPGLVALAYVLTGSRASAEDIAQEAMLAAYRSWSQVGEYEFPAAWARRACANLATSFARRRLVEARALLKLRGRATEVTELDEGASVFWSEVRRLPRRQAQCLALFYMYGCSVAETAQVLDCSQSSVKTHLARGRATVAPRLDLRQDGGSKDEL
jgi:RNA polymerase sigma factor (sigma-70 family)